MGELLCTLHHAVADCLQLTACQDGLKLPDMMSNATSWLGHVGADVFDEAGGQHLLCLGRSVTHLVNFREEEPAFTTRISMSIFFVVFFLLHSRTFRACVRDGPDCVFNGGFIAGGIRGGGAGLVGSFLSHPPWVSPAVSPRGQVCSVAPYSFRSATDESVQTIGLAL